MAIMSEIIIEVFLVPKTRYILYRMPPESWLQTHSTLATRRSGGRDSAPVATWPLWPLASVVTVTVPDLGCGALVLVSGQLATDCRSSDGVVTGTVSTPPPDSRQRTPHLLTAPGLEATWQTYNDTFAWTQTGTLHKYSTVVLFSVYIASGRCGLGSGRLQISENFCHLNSHFISPTAFMNNKQRWLIDIHWII